MADDEDPKLSTATSRARWAERLRTSSSTPEFTNVVEDRPSAATRYVERMRRKREQRGTVPEVGGAPTIIVTPTLVRIIVAMLILERARDEAEKVWRRIRDEKKLGDLVREEERLKERLVETIRQREELEEAMRAGTTPPARRPKTMALEMLANSDEYDVCVECGFFELAASTPSSSCPGCGAVANSRSIGP